MSDYSEDHSPALAETLTALSDSLTHLRAHIARIEDCLASLESKPSPAAKAKSSSTAPAPKKASRHTSRNWNVAAASTQFGS